MATYYVSTTGNDSDPGTIGSPKATEQAAAALAGPGDTVYMRGGTYAQRLYFPSGGTSGSGVITIRNYPSEVVTLIPGDSTMAGNASGGGTTPSNSYVTFKGFVIDGTGTTGFNNGMGVCCHDTGPNHITFEDCEIYFIDKSNFPNELNHG